MMIKPYYDHNGITLYCGDCRDILPQLDKVDLVVADPPYFETKGEFDFVYESFDKYLLMIDDIAKLLAVNLSERGTLYWFGGSKKIAYSQMIFDKYFGLLNNLVWEKAEDDGLYGSTGSEQLRSFPNSTERILMYSRDVYNLTQCVYSIRDYIREEIIRARGKIIFKEINSALGTATNGGGVASACLSLAKTEPAMFTKEMYNKLRDWLNNGREYEYLRREYEELRREYEELRREYEELRRPFDNYTQSTEILKVRFKPSGLEHETVKPLELISLLINTSSLKTDTILDPFCGSGTTLVAAKQLGRKAIGIEISEAYCAIAVKRLGQEYLL